MVDPPAALRAGSELDATTCLATGAATAVGVGVDKEVVLGGAGADVDICRDLQAARMLLLAKRDNILLLQ